MVIDLTVLLNENTPIFPGDKETLIEQFGDYSTHGCKDHYIHMGNHVGTHMDAPQHMIPGGKTLDQFPIDKFVGKGRLIDLTDGNFEKVKHLEIFEGEIVLFRTDASKRYYEKSYFEDFPLMSEEIAEFIVSKKPKMIGLDAGSVDNTVEAPIHKILLGGEVLIIENLTNLSQLEGKEFEVYALPLNVALDGSPSRVVAKLLN